MSAARKTDTPLKMPITFKEFAKNPIVGLMFLCIIAVGYLYVDGKMYYTTRIAEQDKKIEKLEIRVEQLTDALRKSDSTLSAASAKIAVLQEYGKIK